MVCYPQGSPLLLSRGDVCWESMECKGVERSTLQEEAFPEGGLLLQGCVAGMFIHPLKNVLPLW